MRKRKRQLALYLLLIPLLGAFYIQTQHLYFSPEEVFYACERGLHYPPSEEILLEFEAEGRTILVGRQEEGLFVVPTVRSGFLWRMAGGQVDGFFACDEPLQGYITYGGYYLGLCTDERITEVSVIAEDLDVKEWQEFTSSVEEGLLFMETNINRERSFIAYTEGRDAAGDILYQYGDSELAEEMRTAE